MILPVCLFVCPSVQIVSAVLRFLGLYWRKPKMLGRGLYVKIKHIWHHGPQQTPMRSRPAGVMSTPPTLKLGNFFSFLPKLWKKLPNVKVGGVLPTPAGQDHIGTCWGPWCKICLILTYKPHPNNFGLLQYSPRNLRTAETIWTDGQTNRRDHISACWGP